MRLVEGIAELLAPTRCAGCELPGTLLCPECDAGLPRVSIARACGHCGAPHGGIVCTECWSTAFAFDGAVALGEFEGPLARAVVLHKDGGDRRLGAVLGGLLAETVALRWPDVHDVVTWIPPTAAALRRRGFDHGRSLAAPVAASLSCRLAPTLARVAAADQRALSRVERAVNAAGSFAPVGTAPSRVLLVDDVLTTGATLDAAAQALLAAGADSVRVAVVGRAW